MSARARSRTAATLACSVLRASVSASWRATISPTERSVSVANTSRSALRAQLGLVVRHDAVGLRVIAQRLPLFLAQGRQGDRSAGGGLAAALQQRDEGARASGSRLPQAPSSSANAAIRPIRHTRSQAMPTLLFRMPNQAIRVASGRACLAAPPATLRDTNIPKPRPTAGRGRNLLPSKRYDTGPRRSWPQVMRHRHPPRGIEARRGLFVQPGPQARTMAPGPSSEKPRRR